MLDLHPVNRYAFPRTIVTQVGGLHGEDGQVRLTEDHSRVVAVFEDIPAIAIHDLDHVLIAGHWMLASHPGC